VARLPELNKSVIFDLLDFIKELAKPHTIEKTAMPVLPPLSQSPVPSSTEERIDSPLRSFLSSFFSSFFGS
jgi:hypothetical protein